MPKLSLLNGRAFDAGLAALAAVSAGFVAFAMPDPVFTGLVETSRLPDFVAAASRRSATPPAPPRSSPRCWAASPRSGR